MIMTMKHSQGRTSLAQLMVVGAVTILLNVWARRAGYRIPGKQPVRCRAGHVFLTTWVIGASWSKVRLGPMKRWGWCPVGHHWATMRPIRDADLTDDEQIALYGKEQSR